MTATADPAKEYVAMPMTAPDGSEWKPLDYPGIAPGYQVSLYGQVRSSKGRLLQSQWRNGKLIVAVRLSDSNTSTSVRLDRLVLSTFDHYAPHLMPENIDGDESDCQLANLRWREPTERERRSMKAAATRRRVDAAKGGRTKPKETPAAPQAQPETSPRAEVEMFRTYRAAGLTVEVTAAGEIPAKGLPQGKLTVVKVAALAKILTAVVEMNTFMGVGK